jgi:hypothetical protein
VDDPFATGKTQTGYVVGTELASGALGTLSVARARSGDSPGRVVLLRRIDARPPWNVGVLEALRATATKAKGIHHPSTLGIVDVSMAGSVLMVATEYVEGAPLQALVLQARELRRPLPATLGVRIGRQLARAVIAARAALLEEDVQDPIRAVHPECILLTSGDEVLIADLGLITLAQVPDDPRLIAYRAPELLDAGSVPDERAIVYSIGLVLWELLAGRDAFSQSSAVVTASAVRTQVATGAIPRLDRVASGKLSPLLVEIAMQSVGRDPGSRFPSVAALAGALDALGASGKSGDIGRFLHDSGREFIEAQRRVLVPTADRAPKSGRPTFRPPAATLVPDLDFDDLPAADGVDVTAELDAAWTAGVPAPPPVQAGPPRRIGLAAFVPVEPPVVGIDPGTRSTRDVDALLKGADSPRAAPASASPAEGWRPHTEPSDGPALELTQRPITPLPLITPPTATPLPLVTQPHSAMPQPGVPYVPTPVAGFSRVPTPAAPFARVPTPAPFQRVPTPATPFGRFPTPQPTPQPGEAGAARGHFESTTPYVATPLPSEGRLRIMTPASAAPIGMTTPIPTRSRSGLGIALFLLFAIPAAVAAFVIFRPFDKRSSETPRPLEPPASAAIDEVPRNEGPSAAAASARSSDPASPVERRRRWEEPVIRDELPQVDPPSAASVMLAPRAAPEPPHSASAAPPPPAPASRPSEPENPYLETPGEQKKPKKDRGF